jgi:hypothetical protein
MTITAVIKRPNVIVANTVPLTTTQSNPPLELKNNIGSVNQNYLHNLLDVVESNPKEGYTLVYNSITNKYDVAPVSFGSSAVDGGTF